MDPTSLLRRCVVMASAIGLICTLAACGRSDSKVNIDVYAAASLTTAMTSIAAAFESAEPDIHLVLNFAGSATLVEQIKQGAPADVVVFADDKQMNDLVENGNVNEDFVTTIATNTLALVVEKGNPLNIKSVSDLASQKIRTVLCDAAQPCGKYAAQILERSNVDVQPRSWETSVSGVAQKVSSGEADAGIVYVTDALANASKLDAISIDKSINVSNNYPIATLNELSTTARKAAQTFINFVMGDGQKILNDYGFQSP
ncbi:molybdate ABC transporter substrate-binding protein [bacterium]|nr:molybdate ABC transporter substrate-binding protein [bacterium]